MNNVQIVFNEAIAEGIFSEDEAIAYMKVYGVLPLFTFKVWKDRGKVVRKGEHARLVVRLWKRKTGKSSVAADDDTQDNENRDGYFLKTCYLFTADQVEPLTVKQ